MMGCLLSFSPLSLEFQSDFLMVMVSDDTMPPILQMTDFLRAKRLIPLSSL